MTTKQLLREWYAIDYNPTLLKEDREKNGGKLFLSGIIQKANTKNQNQRIYPRNILQREVENYSRAVRENRALGELDHPECVTSGYYLLSSQGWQPIEEIRDGDDVLTLDVITGKIVTQRVTKKIDQAYSGKMVHISNGKGTLEQVITPNHRVLLWDRKGEPYYITAQEFHEKNVSGDSGLSHSYMKRAASWEGEDPDLVVLPGTDVTVASEDWAAFLGIWLAEGYAVGTRGQELKGSNRNVVICQKEGTERHAEIEQLLVRMNIPYEKKLDDRQFFTNMGDVFHRYFYELGNSHTKRIPTDVKSWSPRLLTIFLEWMLKGDGKNRRGYQKTGMDEQPIVKEYATVSRRLADDVHEIMVKLGFGGTIHTYQPKDRKIEEDRWILEENSSPIHIVYGHASRTITMDRRFVKSELVDYNGRVYCIQVPNGNWLARSPSGQTFWTGNSSTVSLERVSHVIREMSWDGDTVLGRVEVLNTPKGQILQSILDSGITIGISSRGVGSTDKTNEGLDMVQDDYQLICFDIVSEPSTPGAYLGLSEGKNVTFEGVQYNKSDRIYRAINDILAK